MIFYLLQSFIHYLQNELGTVSCGCVSVAIGRASRFNRGVIPEEVDIALTELTFILSKRFLHRLYIAKSVVRLLPRLR